MTEAALRGLFDHAGMFPPATKPFDEALRDAAHFPDMLQRPEMIGADLVITAAQWPRLDANTLDAAGFEPRRKCKIAIVAVALGDGSVMAREVGKHNDSRRGARTPVVSLELHFSDEPGRIYLSTLRRAMPGASIFIEPRWSVAQWRNGLAPLVEQLVAQQAGLKFRCAGPTAVDRPTLAAIVKVAADAKIPLKATQGLHHPVASDEHPQGFLTLLAALRLRQRHGAGFKEIESCLAEPDVKAFDLSAGIAWRTWEATAEELAKLPQFAIGSCSLEEPDSDLAIAFGRPVGA